MPQLVIHPGDGASFTREIETEHITLGSGMLNSIVLSTAPAGSKAEINLENGEYHFRNLGPHGGITLNGIAYSQGTLHDGDILRFGVVECVFHLSAPAELPPPETPETVAPPVAEEAPETVAPLDAEEAPENIAPPLAEDLSETIASPIPEQASAPAEIPAVEEPVAEAPPPVPVAPPPPPPAPAMRQIPTRTISSTTRQSTPPPPPATPPPPPPVSVAAPAPPPVPSYSAPPPVPSFAPAAPPPVPSFQSPAPPPVPVPPPPAYAPAPPPPPPVNASLPPMGLPDLQHIAPLPQEAVEAAARAKPTSYFGKIAGLFRAAVHEARRRTQLSTLQSRIHAARDVELPKAFFHLGLAAYRAQAVPGTFGAYYAQIADFENRLIAARQQVIAYAQRGVAQGQAEVAACERNLGQAFLTLGATVAGSDRSAFPANLFDVLAPVETALATLEKQHAVLNADNASRAELSGLLGELRRDTAEGIRHAGTHFAGMVSGSPGEMTLAGLGPALPDRVLLKDRTTIGRDPACDLVLPGVNVSQNHLEIIRQGNGFVLRDQMSTLGTFLNGQRVTQPTPIREGDRLRVGKTTFALHDGALLPSSEKNNTRITVQSLTKTVISLDTKQPLNLLDNVNLVIEPKEFVALLGPSGSGKSTFMDAINGRRRASSGRVMVNDDDFYQSYQYYRRAIGYVPQQDIVHTSLTVSEALRFSARMRLPADTTNGEIEHIIAGVIKKLQLSERAHTRISNLSGGQLKRVSLGVELISDPSLLFLDEATSGLDAGTEGKMMTLFRQIADDGTTVVCITHNVENVSICNMVVVLVRGRLTYYGPPAEMPAYFGVAKISEVYDVLEGQPAEEWARRYEGSELYRKFVTGRMPAQGVPVANGSLPGASTSTSTSAPPPVPAAMPPIPPSAPPPVPGMPPVPASAPPPAPNFTLPPGGGGSQTAELRAGRDPRQLTTNFARQYKVLRQRYALITLQDQKNLLILLAQAPIIALLVGMVFFRHGAKDNQLVIFLMIVSAVWFGCSNAAKEIVKELPIYKRERAINLEILTYLLSKITVLSVLCALQCLALTIIILPLTGVKVGFFGSFFVIYLTSLASMMMGLVVSALVDNTDKANAITPLLLIPQVIFAGAIIKLEGVALLLGRLFIVSFWAFDALCHLADGFVAEPKQPFVVDIFFVLVMLAAFGYAAIWGLRRKDNV